jgi:hypothetical protein
VFSNPNALDQFLVERGIDPEDRRQLITHAGNTAPEFSIESDGVEFFIHSPFAQREDGELIVRNDSAIFAQATFNVEGTETKLILAADVSYSVIEQIVDVTRAHGNEPRLEWHINNIPHHCSYRSLAEEKGGEKTEPSEKMKWLYETQGQSRGLMVSTSRPIPTEDNDQPPHRQAAAYYRDVAADIGGQFVVSMEHPSIDKPKPLTIRIGSDGHTVKKSVAGSAAILTSATPRAGYGG